MAPRRQKRGSPWPAILLAAKVVGVVLWLVSGSNDRAAAERAEAQRRLDEETQIMTHVATAGPAIEARLAGWVSTRDGILLLRDDYTTHALPAATPWHADCGFGLVVTIAGFDKVISDVALDERQCSELLVVLGRAMRSLTDQRPSQQ